MSNSITIAIPAYNRPQELYELLKSILLSNTYPEEVIICEDCSPMRDEIKNVFNVFYPQFLSKNIDFKFYENECNYGYDKNIRYCIHRSMSDWVMLIGNDDILSENAIDEFKRFSLEYNVDFISRTFFKFNTEQRLGISRFYNSNCVVSHKNAKKHNAIFRLAGFVGGLIINKSFAENISTDKYDGSLYYQIWLAANAYCGKGIGYIAAPIIGGRVDNPPMFDQNNGAEFHVPGSYTPKARAAMWSNVLSITADVQNIYNLSLIKDIRHELMVRQSFHVLEMMAKTKKKTLVELFLEFKKINLVSHPIPISLFIIVFLFGRRSMFLFKFIREIYQNE